MTSEPDQGCEDQRAAKRRDEALRRALTMPPKPHRSAEVARLAILAEVDEVLRAIAAIEVSDALVQAVESGVNLPHLVSELVQIQTDGDAAVRTGVLRVRFEPSDRFRDLMAALSAGDGKFVGVKHDQAP